MCAACALVVEDPCAISVALALTLGHPVNASADYLELKSPKGCAKYQDLRIGGVLA